MSNTPPPLPTTPAQAGDSTGGVIPYKNPRALAAYYLGIFSVIPVIGFICGCIALPLGIFGLKDRKKNPAIRGSVHAWIGVIGGGLSIVVHLLIVLSMLAAIGARRH
jgi:hypothetical protein